MQGSKGLSPIKRIVLFFNDFLLSSQSFLPITSIRSKIMSRIDPISSDTQRKHQQNQNPNSDENSEENNYASIHANAIQGKAYPPPRKKDAHDTEKIEAHNLRYGYQKAASLKKQILKQSFKPPANDLYY
jgi:hypothetical protein